MGYSRLLQVTEWLQWVTAGCSRLPSDYRGLQHGYSRLPSDYSGLQQVTTGYRLVTVGYSRLQQVPSGYSGLQQVTAAYRVATVGYSRLQQVTEWLQWVRTV